ncbi:proteinase inhibitor I11, ecotin [Ectopseudomonas mendocina]|uniref:Proteinase inhibitor I11, ecotin n=1 Tax=Ectopseudomonas mendocina TaxID=300 RepID=A0A379IST5_ECTME|nr:serine protease inhibitor ecotin [Pseudomonas mendocina]SUD34323.1 proteinase inhibitor I11, ecotin [Pseudomonas mendocina]SUD39216.1 proteinase inhibitor I11, ecotin [Pseudomonas mendocina]
MNRLKLPLLTLACALPLAACATTPEALKPYPAAEAGYSRHVIELPAQANEAEYKVEIIAGKTLEVDCNQQRLGGQWQEKTVEGWGYSYYELGQVGPAVSTLMACPDGSRKQAFVRVGGEPHLVRYNSKLPLVIYAPNDIEVRYRLWSASGQSSVAPRQ